MTTPNKGYGQGLTLKVLPRIFVTAFPPRVGLAPRSAGGCAGACEFPSSAPPPARRIHDDLGRLRRVLPDGGAKVTIDYELSKITVRDETGTEGFIHLDAWDRPVAAVRRGFDGEWVYRTTQFDWAGNMAVETRPTPDIPISATPRTAYRWDSLGRLLEVQLPDGARIRHRHGFFETTTWDAENHKSYVVRDLDNRLTGSVQLLGSTELPTTYRYREFDLIDTIIDPKGSRIELDYDRRGRRTRLRDLNSGTTAFSYNGC